MHIMVIDINLGGDWLGYQVVRKGMPKRRSTKPMFGKSLKCDDVSTAHNPEL